MDFTFFILHSHFMSISVARTIVLSSDAGAAEYRGGRLGSYVHEGQFAGRPYFRQKDTEGKADNFIFSNGKIWWVSFKLGATKGFLLNRQNTSEPPVNGWHYWNYGLRKWLGDDSSLTLKLTASSPCDLVRVSGKGGVLVTNQENFRHVFGDYRSGCFLLFVFRDHLIDCPTQLTLATWICQLRRRWGPFIRGCKMFGRKDIWGQYFCKMYMVCP